MKNDESYYGELQQAYGEPTEETANGHVRINPSFFAGLLLKEEHLRFVKNRWFRFDGRCWAPESSVKISRQIMEQLRRFAVEFDCQKLLLLTNKKLAQDIDNVAQTIAVTDSFPPMDWRLIPCQNGVLQWDETEERFIFKGFSPEQNVRSLLTVVYDPDADYREFKRVVLDEVLSSMDGLLLQRYLGTALLPINLTENFLLLQGVGGSSKSLLVRILVEILSDQRVFDLEVKSLGQNFELAGLDTQTLLVASESAGDALCSSGASFIKKMVGGDKFQGRRKFVNEKHQLCGNYSLIIVSNEQTAFHYDGNGEEWRRRLLPIFFSKQHKATIKGLALQLVKQHGSGILNWLLEGATDVLRHHWQIPLTPEQETRRDHLIARSEPVRVFIQNCIELSVGDDFTSEEGYRRYCETARDSGLPILSREVFFKQLAVKMTEVFSGVVSSNNLRRCEAGRESRTCRGYREYKLK